jgi:hypothetical protein
MDDASRNEVGVKIFSRMPETQLKSSVKFFYLAMRASEARNGPERLFPSACYCRWIAIARPPTISGVRRS